MRSFSRINPDRQNNKEGIHPYSLREWIVNMSKFIFQESL